MIRNRERVGGTPAREVALDCVVAGVEAADPATVVPDAVSLADGDLVVAGDRYDLDDYDRVVVLGGGKAAGVVAVALEDVLGERLAGGLVVATTPADTRRVEVRTGSHPVPDAANVEHTADLRERAAATDARDLVLAVVTGGGSALLTAPAGELELADVRATAEVLLAAGATVDELNAVRKHCSAIKGGRLAATVAPATVVGLVVSDVVGNDLGVIASGPVAPDDTTFADAQAVLDRYDADVPDAVRAHLEAGAEGEHPETPAGGSQFDRVAHHVLADGVTALAGAGAAARDRGFEPYSLGARIRGEAREVGRTLAGVASAAGADQVRTPGGSIEPPVVLLSGGETTVTVRGDGEGGPNQEVALGAGLEVLDLDGPDSGVVVASVDTDGIDGASDAAGGIATPRTVAPAEEARRALARNDAGGYLARHDGAIETGPTDTNVNDLRIAVVPESG